MQQYSKYCLSYSHWFFYIVYNILYYYYYLCSIIENTCVIVTSTQQPAPSWLPRLTFACHQTMTSITAEGGTATAKFQLDGIRTSAKMTPHLCSVWGVFVMMCVLFTLQHTGAQSLCLTHIKKINWKVATVLSYCDQVALRNNVL